MMLIDEDSRRIIFDSYNMTCSTCTRRRSSVRWGKYVPSLRSTRKHFLRDVTEPRPSEVATTADGRGRGRRVRMDLPANGVSDRFFNSPLAVDWRRPRSYISFRSLLQFVYFSEHSTEVYTQTYYII